MGQATLKETTQIAGLSIETEITRTSGAGVQDDPTLAAAKAGSLTTRTDNDTGVVTLAEGHGILTNDKVSVFWDGGKRYGMTATVSGNLVTAIRPGPAGKAPRPYPVTESGIALIPLDGVLAPRMDAMMEISGKTSTLQFASYVREAAADPEIKAIVVPIDSPGGQAVGLEEAAIALRQARDAKPTIAVVMGTMASAAYYMGAAAGGVNQASDDGTPFLVS